MQEEKTVREALGATAAADFLADYFRLLVCQKEKDVRPAASADFGE